MSPCILITYSPALDAALSQGEDAEVASIEMGTMNGTKSTTDNPLAQMPETQLSAKNKELSAEIKKLAAQLSDAISSGKLDADTFALYQGKGEHMVTI